MTLHGLHANIEEADYHSGPELSSTGAKTILRCPAEYAYEREHPVHKDVYDLGSLAHRLILGTGWPVYVVDCTAWTSSKDRKVRDEKRAAGYIVVNRDQLRQASRMAQSVRRHPDIGPMFTGEGINEASVYAVDEATGAPMRCRPDRLTETTDGRTVCIDVKTSGIGVHADQTDGKYGAISKFGYHQSAAFYLDVLAANDIDAMFLLVFVHTERPHRVSAVVLDRESIAYGRELNAKALRIFADRTASGDWSCPHPVFRTASIFNRPQESA